jgi:hypothetical protein
MMETYSTVEKSHDFSSSSCSMLSGISFLVIFLQDQILETRGEEQIATPGTHCRARCNKGP